MSSVSSHLCRAAVFTATDRPLELREFDVPDPQAGEAVVRVECCTVCGSDLHTITGKREEPTPTILGHEILGRVESVGEPPLNDLTGEPLSPGARITWSVAVSCGECDRCQSGFPQKCRSLVKYGHSLAIGPHALSGGFAEKILLRAGTAAIKVDESLPAEVICPVNCATATIAAAYRVGGETTGQNVLIFGAGMLGLTAAAWANSAKARSVTVCDQNSTRLEQAKRFGANRTILWQDDREAFQTQLLQETDVEGFDLILELSGAPAAISAAAQLTTIGSRIVLVGSVMPVGDVGFDPEQIVRRWLSIHGVHNYTPSDLATAVRFLEAHQADYPWLDIVETEFSLDEINDAVRDAIERRPIRMAVKPQPGAYA
ncbi:MAG: alcohol dehydrogenase catalytic domain-containing protein [Planctomycetaceae bacterium]|nr:alcohol dehydrogenase catalytic domain-containing protein [Planctomycetaceae bacterium]